MDSQDRINELQDREENVLFGIVGAFLFALAGGILYYVLYQIGYLAGISGLIGVICAIKGYSFFAKKESVRGIVIAIIMAVIVLVSAWYFCMSSDLYMAYQEWYASGEVDYMPTFFECVSAAYLVLADVPEYFIDLGVSLLLAVVGCGGYVVRTIKKTTVNK